MCGRLKIVMAVVQLPQKFDWICIKKYFEIKFQSSIKIFHHQPKYSKYCHTGSKLWVQTSRNLVVSLWKDYYCCVLDKAYNITGHVFRTGNNVYFPGNSPKFPRKQAYLPNKYHWTFLWKELPKFKIFFRASCCHRT